MSRKPTYEELLQKNTELESMLAKAQHIARKQWHSESRLAEIIDFLPDAMFAIDIEGKVTIWNRAIEELTGIKSEDILGKGDYEYAIPFYGVRRPVLIDLVLNWDEETERKYVYLKRKGNILFSETSNPPFRESPSHFWNSASPLYDASGDAVGAIEVIRDITDRQRMETELLKMEKLQSLGVLAGGIAHDFNNFLTGIIGNLSLAKLDVQPGHPMLRALGEMEKAAIRAKDLTEQLLTFSKGGAPVKQTTSIVEMVRESAQFALHGSNVCGTFEIDEGLRPADVDKGQIAQVIQNLMINADQAMPDGGTVLIRCTNISLVPDNPNALAPGDYVQLSVQDQGVGIKTEHLKKVFDPYFTTKQKGSGLGLAVAHSITAKHDGQLTVDSKLGEGTTFTILLPASEKTQEVDTKEKQGIISGHGRILVMDNEDFIRELAAAMLHKMGYDVALAQDGQAAVNIYKDALEAGSPFDAAILDLTVPGGMGGKETLRQLSALDPNVRAIVSSGYSNDPVMADHASYGFCGAVKKPYLVQEMSQVLNAVIKR